MFGVADFSCVLTWLISCSKYVQSVRRQTSNTKTIKKDDIKIIETEIGVD